MQNNSLYNKLLTNKQEYSCPLCNGPATCAIAFFYVCQTPSCKNASLSTKNSSENDEYAIDDGNGGINCLRYRKNTYNFEFFYKDKKDLLDATITIFDDCYKLHQKLIGYELVFHQLKLTSTGLLDRDIKITTIALGHIGPKKNCIEIINGVKQKIKLISIDHVNKIVDITYDSI